MKTRKWTWLTGFLGYDPVEKQHKVLAMTSRNDRSKEHQVLTLGTGNLTWRMVKCGKPHPFPVGEGLCINGVLYYTAVSDSVQMLICFDFRSEKYSFVKPPPERNLKMEKLINFQGKLASVRSRIFDSEESLTLEILILKDPKKHEWAIRIFNLPPMWKDGAAGKYLDVVGVTATNELVLSPRFPSYLYYYNFVSEDISRVDIQGIGAFEKEPRAHVILNHVEDAKIMELF